MPVDAKLLEILCCPVSHTPLTRLGAEQLQEVNRLIQAGELLYVGGEPVNDSLDEILVTEDMKVMYPVHDGIPVLLEEKGIGTTQIQAFN